MIETAAAHDGPIAIRYPKGAAASLPTLPVDPLPIGVWEVRREGTDLLLLAAGRMVETAEKVATTLGQRGVAATVVNARWVKPLDERLGEWVGAHRLTVTLEDNVLAGGFGAAVLEKLVGTGLGGRVVNVGLPDTFLPFGSAEAVLEWAGLDHDSVLARIEAVFA
jgi:1-deoxy-D-xylulose-5-phosphate synthase